MTASLVDRLASDLDGAFPIVVDEYGSMVMTLSCGLADAATAEDITQEVFLRVYRALAEYDAERIRSLDLRPWLATIGRNLVRNESRRRSRKPTVPLDSTPIGETTTDNGATIDDSPSATAEIADDTERLRQMLAELSDQQREAVVLRHLVGLPLHEVALTMGCPDGTAKSHVSRGLARLREVLATQPDQTTEGRGRP